MKLIKINLNDYSKIETGVLEIGDVVITEHIHFKFKNIHEIDAVTNTMGKCNCGNYIERYSREIAHIHTVPRDTWDVQHYCVYRKLL